MVDKMSFEVGDRYDASDSEDEYSEREKKLLKRVRNSRKKDVDSEEEVLGFDDDESDSEIEKFDHDSDIEDKEDDDDLPDSRAWGTRKRDYYGTDFIDRDYDTYTAKEEELAKQEENEAREIQQRLAKELDEADFSLDVFTSSVSQQKEDKSRKSETKLKADLSDLSQRQKLQLFKKEAPEFDGLVEDFIKNIEECEEILEPVLAYFKSKNISNIPVVDFAKTRYDLCINYCNNISFYLLLKSKRIQIKNHPVVKRMVQIRQLLSTLEEKYQEVVKPQLEKLLKHIATGEDIIFNVESAEDGAVPKAKPKKLGMLKTLETGEESDIDEEEDEELEEAPESKKPRLESDDSEEEQVENEEGEGAEELQIGEAGDVKRGITYQIAKNKGLTPHRKKELRNVRVKNKHKYKKALIRRKGAIQGVRTETTRYGGESSGIKSFVKRSIKIK